MIEIIWLQMPEQLGYIMHVSTAASLSQDQGQIHHTSKDRAAFPAASPWMGNFPCATHSTGTVQSMSTRHWYKNPLPDWYFPQAAGRTLTLLLEAPLCGITQLISPGANGVQPVRPWFGRAWGVICKALLCNEPAGKLSLTHWEKAIPNLLLTREHHIIEWTLQFSQDH